MENQSNEIEVLVDEVADDRPPVVPNPVIIGDVVLPNPPKPSTEKPK